MAFRGGLHDPKSSLFFELLCEHDVFRGEEEGEGEEIPFFLFEQFLFLEKAFVLFDIFDHHVLPAELSVEPEVIDPLRGAEPLLEHVIHSFLFGPLQAPPRRAVV